MASLVLFYREVGARKLSCLSASISHEDAVFVEMFHFSLNRILRERLLLAWPPTYE